jgi:hypothetical protein
MTEDTLRQLLARVHERLSSSTTIDPEERTMLATVMRDIDGALRGSAGEGATPPRLEALAVRFEAKHPAIAQLLRQIGDLLGQAGI